MKLSVKKHPWDFTWGACQEHNLWLLINEHSDTTKTEIVNYLGIFFWEVQKWTPRNVSLAPMGRFAELAEFVSASAIISYFPISALKLVAKLALDDGSIWKFNSSYVCLEDAINDRRRDPPKTNLFKSSIRPEANFNNARELQTDPGSAGSERCSLWCARC